MGNRLGMNHRQRAVFACLLCQGDRLCVRNRSGHIPVEIHSNFIFILITMPLVISKSLFYSLSIVVNDLVNPISRGRTGILQFIRQ